MSEQKSVSPEAQKWLDGQVIFINKPLRWTSFDLVRKVRYGIRNHFGLKKIKVGHAGTLDPLATGMMVICTGKATKTLVNYQDLGKEYVAGIRFGSTTPSFDLETEVDASFSTEKVTREALEQVLSKMIGAQQQVPPLFSAKKIGGRRAYDIAREGNTVEIKPQSIEIYSMEILSFELPDIVIRVSCSKGTYIRSLARDLGLALGSGAHLISLSRTAIGSHTLDKALNVDDLDNYLLQL
ncbi:MAG: tRNA pseudouridine(55) synthase TruB [Bacteroidales bacterium]|nr:tRNA pseudouridine(55) synthase TruB [Bacteroidales bacterium]